MIKGCLPGLGHGLTGDGDCCGHERVRKWKEVSPIHPEFESGNER